MWQFTPNQFLMEIGRASKDFAYWKTPQNELAGKTLGIVGFGQIGQTVAKIGLAFGMKIIFTNRSKKETGLQASQVELETLFAESDFISINCPLTPENTGFINKSALGKMKPDYIPGKYRTWPAD